MSDANKPEGPAAGAPAPAGTTVSPGEPADIVAYATIQFATGGLLDCQPVDDLIHLVRRRRRGGTPGPTLCGIDRFADSTPGWSVDGGLREHNVEYRACPDCAAHRRPLPVTSSMWRHLFPPPLDPAVVARWRERLERDGFFVRGMTVDEGARLFTAAGVPFDIDDTRSTPAFALTPRSSITIAKLDGDRWRVSWTGGSEAYEGPIPPPPTCGWCGEPFVGPDHRVIAEGPPRIVTCPTVDPLTPIIVPQDMKVYPL